MGVIVVSIVSLISKGFKRKQLVNSTYGEDNARIENHCHVSAGKS